MRQLFVSLIAAVGLLAAFFSPSAAGAAPASYGTLPYASDSAQLIKLACHGVTGVNDPCRAVYYVTTDGVRHAFPNEQTYFTWFKDFSRVTIVSSSTMASHPLGKNVTYRPGIRMVKFQTSPTVYAVTKGGVLRSIANEALAVQLYGTNWRVQVDDVSDAFASNYRHGAPIMNRDQYDPISTIASVTKVSENF